VAKEQAIEAERSARAFAAIGLGFRNAGDIFLLGLGKGMLSSCLHA